jgi:WD40 repeat protein
LPDGDDIITRSKDGIVCKWSLSHPFSLSWEEGVSTVTCLAGSLNGELLAFGCSDGSIRLLDLEEDILVKKSAASRKVKPKPESTHGEQSSKIQSGQIFKGTFAGFRNRYVVVNLDQNIKGLVPRSDGSSRPTVSLAPRLNRVFITSMARFNPCSAAAPRTWRTAST